MMVVIIVASHAEAKGKFGVFRVHAQSSRGGGRVTCPALSTQLIGKSNNTNAVKASCHRCPGRDARLLQACSCLLAALVQASLRETDR